MLWYELVDILYITTKKKYFTMAHLKVLEKRIKLYLHFTKVRATGTITFALSSFGIVNTPCEGHQNAHVTFKINLKMSSYDDTSDCNVYKQTNTAKK